MNNFGVNESSDDLMDVIRKADSRKNGNIDYKSRAKNQDFPYTSLFLL